MRVDATNTAGANRFLVGYAVDAPLVTSKIQFSSVMVSGVVTNLNAGQGFVPMEQASQVLRQGLTIWSQTALTPGANQDSSSDFGCRVMYI